MLFNHQIQNGGILEKSLYPGAVDPEDGDLSPLIVWTSSIDGSIGTITSVSAVLSDDPHTITASVTDSGALTDAILLVVRVRRFYRENINIF